MRLLVRNAALAGLLGIVIAGCGQSEYDSRMDGALAVSKKRGGGGANDAFLAKDYVTIADAAGRSTGIKFKLPAAFSNATRLGPEVPAAKLAQAEIPGLCYTLQITLADNAQKQYPAYCHVYAVPKAETQLDSLKDTIKQGVAAIQPKDWTVGTVGGVPTGLPIHYMSPKGNMDFEVGGAVEQAAGTIAIFIVEGTNDYAVVAFRYENNSGQQGKLLDGVASSMVTFVPEGAAPANPAPAPAMP
jgi:hypothetical protein